MISKENPSNSFETHTVIDYLFITGLYGALDKAYLIKIGIQHIINITKTADNEYPNDFTYHNICVDDEKSSDLSQYFDETTIIIDKAIKAKEGVLVHCMAGISRSSTMVIAYLIRYLQMSLMDAYWHVKTRRHCISPNEGFMEQLSEWESKCCCGKITLDVDDYRVNRFKDKWTEIPKPKNL